MERKRRFSLIAGILTLSVPVLWVLSAVALEEGAAYIARWQAVLYVLLGLFFLGLYGSPRVRERREAIAETTTVQAGIFLLGTVLLVITAAVVFDLLTVFGSQRSEYYIASVFYVVVCGTAGSSFVYVTGRELFGNASD